MSDQEMALAMATGISNGAAHTIPAAFFGTHTNILKVLGNPVFQKEETLDGDECYVISGGLGNQKFLLWISKKSLLIRQRRQILGGAPFIVPRTSEEDIKHTLKSMGQTPTTQAVAKMKETMANAGRMMSNIKGNITETHKNIIVDPPLAKGQFTPKSPTTTTAPKS